jgi:hypothetical protein
MNRLTQSRLEMGARALEFSLAHPDEKPGIDNAIAQVKALLVRADQLVREQEAGTVQARAASARKQQLLQLIRRGQLVHLARVAARAASESPDLAQKFDLPRVPRRQLPFRNIARTMLEEAQRNKELLIKYGLSERVLDGLAAALDELDLVTQRGVTGRRIHIAAVANLNVVGDEVVQNVGIIDGSNRVRFAPQPELLTAWNAASNVFELPRAGGDSEVRSGGEVVPSATPGQPDQAKPAA